MWLHLSVLQPAGHWWPVQGFMRLHNIFLSPIQQWCHNVLTQSTSLTEDKAIEQPENISLFITPICASQYRTFVSSYQYQFILFNWLGLNVVIHDDFKGPQSPVLDPNLTALMTSFSVGIISSRRMSGGKPRSSKAGSATPPASERKTHYEFCVSKKRIRPIWKTKALWAIRAFLVSNLQSSGGVCWPSFGRQCGSVPG